MIPETGGRLLLMVDSECSQSVHDFVGGRQFALLLPAYSFAEMESSLKMAGAVLAAGCIEICCVGRLAKELEDSVDAALELDGALHVATTSFLDSNEAAEYFIHCAGGGVQGTDLVALIGRHPLLREYILSLIR